jgi:hypothetical protein
MARRSSFWEPENFSCRASSLAYLKQMCICWPGGEWCGRPGQQSPRGRKVNILMKKKLIFCAKQVLNYRDKKKKFNECDFLKVIYFFRGGGSYCYCSARASKNLATPLLFMSYNSVCTQIKNCRFISRKQLVDDRRETRRYWKLTEGTISHYLENSLWKMLWTCRKTDYMIDGWWWWWWLWWHEIKYCWCKNWI